MNARAFLFDPDPGQTSVPGGIPRVDRPLPGDPGPEHRIARMVDGKNHGGTDGGSRLA